MTMALRLIYGIPALPTDENSAEQGIEVIALAAEDNANAGWFLDETIPFMPKIASLKGGGIWIDSAADDGRSLQNDSVDNVIETINLKLVGDFATRYHYLSQINRFADQARKFHTTQYQTEPVQLEWWAEGAPGPQYAVVFDISVDVRRAAYDQSSSFDVTITLEREPAWRGVLFGWPATVWTQYKRGNAPGAGYDLIDLSLVNGDPLYLDTVDNKHEFDGANGYTYDDSPLTKNWIDIDADDIPGDAPALVSIALKYTNFDSSSVTQRPLNIYLAKSTKPRYWIDQSGTKRPQFYSLNGADAGTYTSSITTTANANEGNISNGSSTQRYYVNYASGFPPRISWGAEANGGTFQDGKYGLSLEAFRGKFAVFARVEIDGSNVNTFRLDYDSKNSYADQLTGLQKNLIPDYVGEPGGVSTEEYTIYLGDIALPLSDRSDIGEDGTGLYVPDMSRANTEFVLVFDLDITNTTNGHFIDLILLPYDEGQIRIMTSGRTHPDFNALDWGTGDLLYDNTGYITRELTSIVKLFNSPMPPVEMVGSDIMLDPKIDNRIYLMFNCVAGNVDYKSTIDLTMDLRLNIIPRWYGVRDE